MGTKLNKKNEKRKNIHRIIVGILYKKRKNEQQKPNPPTDPSSNSSPKGSGVITEIPRIYDDKVKTE